MFLANDVSLQILTPENTIFGFINGIENNIYKTTNRVILFFKQRV